MKCVRCEQNKEVQYRVFTDIMDIKECADCAAEARELHIGIETLKTEQGEYEQTDEYMRQAS
jgi:hypothetical protein